MMQVYRDRYPYIIGILIGIIMVPLFLFGHRFTFSNYRIIGEIMMITGLVLWPLYALGAFVWSAFIFKQQGRNNPLAKALFRSIFIAPLGAIVAVVIIMLIYVIIQ